MSEQISNPIHADPILSSSTLQSENPTKQVWSAQRETYASARRGGRCPIPSALTLLVLIKAHFAYPSYAPPPSYPSNPHHASPYPLPPPSQHRLPLHTPHLHHHLHRPLPPPPTRRAHRPQRTPFPHQLPALQVPPQGLANRLHLLRRQFYVQEDCRSTERSVSGQGSRCRSLA